MERLTRSLSKNNGIGAKNKTQKQEQSPKGISKNVKTAIRKMKTAIKRHVAGSCSINSGSPESGVENNSTLKRKANANMQNVSPNKRNNRQTSSVLSASSKDISNTSGHVPASPPEKASKKKTDNSKRTGKIRKPNKKVDKSKILNIKKTVVDDVKNNTQTPSCSTTNVSATSSGTSNIVSSKAIRNKWLKKRIEKEQLKKSTTPEVRTRYSAQNRLQQLRDRLSKEAESETNAAVADPKAKPNVAVLKPLIHEQPQGYDSGWGTETPIHIDVLRERFRSRASRQTSAVENSAPRQLLTASRSSWWIASHSDTESNPAEQALRDTPRQTLPNTCARNSTVQLPTLNLNIHNTASRQPSTSTSLPNTFVQNSAARQALSNMRLQSTAAEQASTSTYVQNSASRQPSTSTSFQITSLQDIFSQNSAARQPLPNTFAQNSTVQLPTLNLNVQNSAAEQASTSTYVQNSASRQPSTSTSLQNIFSQNSAARQPLPNTYAQNSTVQLPTLNFNASGQPSTSTSLPNTYVQNSTARQSLSNTYVQSSAAGQPSTSTCVQNSARLSNVNLQNSEELPIDRDEETSTDLIFARLIDTASNNANELHMRVRERQYEDMDVDLDDIASPNPFVHSSCPQSNQRLVIVIDTNVFIHKLSIIKHIVSSYFIGYIEKPTIIIPWRVINELDTLKDNRSRPAVQRLANDAMNYLYDMLPNKQWLQGQTLIEAKNHLFACEVPDDEILNCCFQQAARGNAVILLTNDKNLCNKATINGIKNMSSFEIENKLEDRLFNYAPGELIQARLRIYKANIYNLLSTILKNEMQRAFEENWPLIIFINPPWTLMDVLICILNHWIAVFHLVFPRIKPSIVTLKNLLSKLEDKEMAALTDNEVGAFQAICMEIANKCQIIADYIDLATVTVNDLTKSPHMDVETKELREEKILNDIFHNVHTYVSSYCAKVCTGLGIQHNLVDEISSNESLDDLLTVLPLFNRRISNFTQTLLKALNANADKVLPEITNLNSICVEINESFAFLNKCEVSPTYYFGKCRDRFLQEYKSYSDISELLKKCLAQVRDNALIRV